MDRPEIAAVGGAPNADFAVEMKLGFAINQSIDAISGAARNGGLHGYLPSHPEMRASFVIAGPGIRRGANVGDIDMRSIAPTLAKLMGASLGERGTGAGHFLNRSLGRTLGHERSAIHVRNTLLL
jgi:hypothetical protein